MAERLIRYYAYVAKEAGLQGKTQLAMRTKVPSAKAALTPDDPEVLESFRRAVAEITGRPAPDL